MILHQLNWRQVNCVSIENNQDPPPELLHSLRKHYLDTQVGSECYFDQTSSPGIVLDRNTAKPARHVHVRKIRMRFFIWAIAEGVWITGGLSGESHRYWLRKKNGKWAVAKDILISIS